MLLTIPFLTKKKGEIDGALCVSSVLTDYESLEFKSPHHTLELLPPCCGDVLFE